MSSDADRFWETVAGKLRKKKGFCPLTAEEAEAAFDKAPSVPLSKEQIASILKAATSDVEDEDSDDDEWQDDDEMTSCKEKQLQLFRKPGEGDEEARKNEKELEDEMLNDDDPEEEKA